jgi:hypothetical protein
MNQRFSSQDLTAIVGATARVALGKHEMGFRALTLTRKPHPLLPLHGACTEPLALRDSEWGSERGETCPGRIEWREGVRQAAV